MHLRLRTLLFFALLASPVFAQQYLEMIEAGTYTLTEIRQAAEAHFDIVGRERGSGYKQFKRWEYVAEMELDENGVKIPNFELSKRARDYRREVKQQQTESSGFGGDWKQLGPTYSIASSSWSPGLGRITAIGIDESNFNHLIVGSPTGGVWKSLNGGNSWMPIADEYVSIDVYALEISPYDNMQYLWGGSSGKVFRSLDGGASWNTTGNLTGNGKVSRIQYHPTDPNIVYAVSESNGLFRSTNKGSSWTAVAGVSGLVGYDIEFKPGDPNTIYFSGISVYRSTDGGSSFSQIGGFGTANNNHKRMAVSPANPNFVYVLEAQGGRFGGFYKSTDSGASFTKLIDGSAINYLGYSQTGDDDKGQAPRNMDITIHPQNANEIHIGGIHTWKSLNGGASFDLTSYWIPATAASLGVGYNHADIDVLKFAGNTLLVGTDGGFYISTNGAASFEDRSIGLSVKELYKIGVSKTNPNVVTGGSQDNGTCVMRGANRSFVDWLGADGMETFVDWNNANNLYGTSQYGSMYRSTNQGTTRSSISKPPDVDDGAWVTPFEQDPQISNTIYVAFADVWKTSNYGTVWTKISEFDNGNLNQMKLAPSSNQRIYVSKGATLFTTANGGTSWTTITSGWGTSSISYIAVHPQNPLRLLIVTSSGVYHSTNAGTSWTSIGAGLPSGTKYCAAWENTGKNGIYIGGFGFVSYTNDDLAGQWVGFLDGLPNGRVYELEINYISNTIFAGTYGRGLWESPLYKALAPVAAFTADKHEDCQEATVNFTDNSTNSPTAWEWTFEGGTPATSNLQHPTVTFSGNGMFEVRLKSSNSIGESITEAVDSILVFEPTPPMVADTKRCDAGEVTLEAIGHPADQINWYASGSDPVQLYSGETFTTNISQSTTFYAVTGTDYIASERVGPSSNTIGGGGDHAGDQFLIFDVEKPFYLSSARVYAAGASNRTFQLRDANGVVLLEKTVYVNDGESRIDLGMDIPQGIGLQIGCISPANLYRNNSGVSYPYSIPGVMQIKSSTAGSSYYYYLYDLDIEHIAVCESDRIPVTGTVINTPSAPTLVASGPTVLCPGESITLTADNICADCMVYWSNGASGPSITVETEGSFTAIVRNTLDTTCGDSPPSNAIIVTQKTAPVAAAITSVGPTALCPDESVVLSANDLCHDCTVYWSNGETGPNITVETEGTYFAVFGNVCGNSPESDSIAVTMGIAPTVPSIAAAGTTSLCPGASVLLTATDICPGCTVSWSNGETGPGITVSTAGNYTASTSNVCGESPASSAIAVTSLNIPQEPTLIPTGLTTLCPGASVLLSATDICPDCIVIWSNGDTGPGITVSTAGNYTASASNVCGESQASNAIAVTSIDMPFEPTISAAGTTALCPGESVELTASDVCPGCIVHWSNGETGPGIMVSMEGNYTASTSNVCGESQASNAIEVNIGDLPEAPIISPPGSWILCPGDSVVLTVDNLCPDCVINWSTGETTSSITVFTTEFITSTYTNACGTGQLSNTVQVFLETLPPAPIISHTGSVSLCPGDSLRIEVLNDCFGCLINWSNGDSGWGIFVSDPGVYTASFNQFGFCGDGPPSNAVTVLVNPPFIPELQVIDLCDLAAPAGSNYQWYLNGALISGATGQFWSAESAGNYSVTMLDDEGCPGTSQPVFAEACVSGVLDLQGIKSLRVYPNPAQDKVFLDYQVMQAVNARIDLYAADGRYSGQLFQGLLLPGRQTLEMELPTLAAGIYQYRLVTEKGNLMGNLVVLQR
ncbi:MAG: VPS10 domain-containing protein [Saprospiraceae bacterium]